MRKPRSRQSKDATIIATLKADSGYSSNETHRISADQWSRIVAIMNEATTAVAKGGE